MIQKIGIVKESPEDTIVALTPDNVHNLSSHFDILIERDAGLQSGYTNKMYQDAGATIMMVEKIPFRKVTLLSHLEVILLLMRHTRQKQLSVVIL